jgi:hypothetical protein
METHGSIVRSTQFHHRAIGHKNDNTGTRARAAYDLDTKCSAGFFLPLRSAFLLRALGRFLLALFPSLHAFHVGLLTVPPDPIVAPRRIQCRGSPGGACTPSQPCAGARAYSGREVSDH